MAIGGRLPTDPEYAVQMTALSFKTKTEAEAFKEKLDEFLFGHASLEDQTYHMHVYNVWERKRQ